MTHEFETILKNDLATFIEFAFGELNPQTRLQMGDYIEVIASKLQACVDGKIKRLAICLPPRSLKSHCASVVLPAWILGHNPAAQIICASYGQDLSEKFALDCRNVMSSAWYKKLFPFTRLAPNKMAVNDFMTTQKGFRMSTSVGGVLTGRGADFIIIDDPLKPDEALSETRRNAVNEWYDHTLLSRLNDKTKGCIIIVMQRLHQDDLLGHVLEQEGWEVVSFPAVAEQDETHIIENIFGKRLFARKIGEVFHPERDTLATFEEIRRKQGEYVFLSQYQQNPAPPGGAMVKTGWLRYYEERPGTFDMVFQSWDTACKAGELNDFSVCTTWGLKGKHIYLLDVFRKRMEFPDLKRAVREQAQLHKAKTVLIEDKASGTSLIQELINEGMHAVKRYEPTVNGDKQMRLHAQTATIENGFVLLPKDAPWLADYVAELTSFPGCKHDDQVDSTTQALDWVKQMRSSSAYGWLEYMRLQVEEMHERQKYHVRMKVPEQLVKGGQYTIPGGRTLTIYYDYVYVTDDEAEILSRHQFLRWPE